MITVRDVESFLYTWAPAGLAASWDNVGLLAGDGDAEVRKVLVALDVTEAVAAEAVTVGADLIVACGGGSVMDAAELASVLVTDEYGVKELLDNPETFKALKAAEEPTMTKDDCVPLYLIFRKK